MAGATALAAYSMKVWSLQAKKAEQASQFAGSSDLLHFFIDVLGGLAEQTVQDQTIQQVLTVKKHQAQDRRLFGIIETGEYGVESDLWSIESKSVVYRRKKTEADMRPFYFLMDIPEGPDEGILLLQRAGTLGIRKVLQDVIRPKFEAKFPEYRLRIDPLVESEELEKYTKGKVQSIRFIRFGIPSDIAEAYDSGHQEVDGFVELVVRARRGKSLPLNNRLKQFFSGKHELGGLIALDETGFEYDNIKVNTKVGKSSRTIDLANPNRLRSYHDISSEIEVDNSGANETKDVSQRRNE
jgi:hypothetical protein